MASKFLYIKINFILFFFKIIQRKVLKKIKKVKEIYLEVYLRRKVPNTMYLQKITIAID
jgi:hypothetical protein